MSHNLNKSKQSVGGKKCAKHVLTWPSDAASHEVHMIQAVAAATDKLDDDTTVQHVNGSLQTQKKNQFQRITNSSFFLSELTSCL